MGRGGVTFTEVEQAALYLQGNGRNPTVDSIRDHLGTGSRTTLAIHLKNWKRNQPDHAGRLPQELMSVVTGLWDHLQEQANGQVISQQTDFNTKITALREELRIAKESRIESAKSLASTQLKLNESQHIGNILTTELQQAIQSIKRLETLQQSTEKQLENSKGENQRLHKLATQIQKNLEHYQHAIQQQKIDENMWREKKEAEYHLKNSKLAVTLDDLSINYAKAEKKLVEYARQQAEYTRLIGAHDNLEIQHREMEHNCIRLKTQLEILQKRYTDLQQDHAEEMSHYQGMNQKLAVLDDQVKNLKSALLESENKASALKHENLRLTQEGLNH